MANQPMTLYKLMILFMLDHLEFPLTGSTMSEFIVSRGYTSYFHFQQSLNELKQTGFLNTDSVRNVTSYSLSEEGKEAIRLFSSGIPGEIKQDILDFFDENKLRLRKEIDVISDYHIQDNGEYLVRMQINDRGNLLFAIDLNVVTRSQAIDICDKWSEKSDAVYQQIIDMLFV